MQNANRSPNRGGYGLILLLAGGYVVYMAYGMVQNTRMGLSSMSMQTTAILASLMALSGLAVAGYGAYLSIRSRRQNTEQENEDRPEL